MMCLPRVESHFGGAALADCWESTADVAARDRAQQQCTATTSSTRLRNKTHGDLLFIMPESLIFVGIVLFSFASAEAPNGSKS